MQRRRGWAGDWARGWGRRWGGRWGGRALLALAFLAGGAANDIGLEMASGTSAFVPKGALGAYLTGRFAGQSGDLDLAADRLETALTEDAGVSEVASQAFVAAVLAGRPGAARLAVGVADNAVAQLVLANRDARAENWPLAEARFTALPQQGLTQILRPLLVAWAQAGAGRTSTALSTLRPALEAQRFRGVMTLHAALIADLGGFDADAARLYPVAMTEYGGLNIRLGTMIASWQARQGLTEEAQRTVRDTVGANGDLALARGALTAHVADRAVRTAADGIAETYLAMAATLRQQNALDSAQLLLRLALDMREDFTAARLLLADIQDANRKAAALETLAPVAADDPLAPVVALRRASLLDGLGRTAEATALLEGLAEAHPDRPEPLAQLGDHLRRATRYAEAAAVYDRAIARIGTPARTQWPVFYERGVALERSGQWPRAEADFEYALELAPDQPNVLNYLGYAWVEQNRNMDRARSMIERAVALRPNDGAFLDSLGWVLLRQGDAAGALRQLERAVELQPEDPVVNAHYGDVLEAVGRGREAQFQWRRALNLRPEPDDQARIEAKLRAAEASQAAVPVP